jgi:hypothetical protein
MYYKNKTNVIPISCKHYVLNAPANPGQYENAFEIS